MTRNFGLPTKPEDRAFQRARDAKPVLTLAVTAIFGVIGASVAAISFTGATDLLEGLYHGPSLIGAVLCAGFGCWAYIWIARPRFAAHFKREGDAFSDLLRFYARATLALVALLALGRFIAPAAGEIASSLALCTAGGAAAAAAFQTVLAFVPAYGNDAGA